MGRGGLSALGSPQRRRSTLGREAFVLAVALQSALTGSPHLAFAQGAAPVPTDAAQAEKLYREGRALMGQKQYAEACPKLAESQRLDPGVGTLLYLGDCYEQLGKTASAYAAFQEAYAQANATGQSRRAKVAQKHASELQQRLSTLTIQVQEAPPELQVYRDGQPLSRSVWGQPEPLDPGEHKIEARAPGRIDWSTRIRLAQGPAHVLVTVPTLGLKPPAPEPRAKPPAAVPTASYRFEPPPALDTGTGTSRQRTIAIAVGAVGVGALATGTWLALRARSKDDDAVNNHCRPDNPSLCDSQGIALNDEAQKSARWATVSFAAGGAALALGTVLFLTAPRPDSTSSAVRLTPTVTPQTATLTLGGRF